MKEVINNIYRKQLIEAYLLANGWDRKKISELIQFCYKNGHDFKHAARTYRSKHSMAKAMEYSRQRKLKYFL